MNIFVRLYHTSLFLMPNPVQPRINYVIMSYSDAGAADTFPEYLVMCYKTVRYKAYACN